MHLVLSDKYESLRDALKAIPESFEQTGVVIYDARNQIRVVELPNGLTLNIKRFHRPALFNRIIYTWLRPSKAERAYRNAQLLHALHIPTPEAVAYIENKNPLLQESYLITVQSPLTRNFYEFRYHSVEGYEDIIQAFAKLMADAHQKGVLHQDLSPGNILFDKQDDGTISFSLVDINRMRFGRSISKEEACRNFCRLWGRMDFIEALSRSYAASRGWDAEEVTRLINRYWRQYWHIRTEQDIENLFDRTLKR